MDMKNVVDHALASSRAAARDVVLELHAKRHCSAAVIASTGPLSLDNGSASDVALFGTPEGADSGGSPAGSVFDDGASARDAYEGPSGPVSLAEQFSKDPDRGKSVRSLASRASEWSAAPTSCGLSLVHFSEVGAFAPLAGARLMLSCRAGFPVFFLAFCTIASQSRLGCSLGLQCL